jgi:hypothetical protein
MFKIKTLKCVRIFWLILYVNIDINSYLSELIFDKLGSTMKFRVSWDVLPCSQADVGQHVLEYTAVHPRRL